MSPMGCTTRFTKKYTNSPPNAMLISNSSRPTWLICAMAAMRVLVGTMLTMVQSSSGMRS